MTVCEKSHTSPALQLLELVLQNSAVDFPGENLKHLECVTWNWWEVLTIASRRASVSFLHHVGTSGFSIAVLSIEQCMVNNVGDCSLRSVDGRSPLPALNKGEIPWKKRTWGHLANSWSVIHVYTGSG